LWGARLLLHRPKSGSLTTLPDVAGIPRPHDVQLGAAGLVSEDRIGDRAEQPNQLHC